MAGNNNGNNMRSIESSKSSIPSQDCNEAVTSSSAAPPAAACHWPVQHRNTTMLMTQIYVEYVSYWMTQHVFSRFKARRKVSNLRSSIWHGITSKGNARKSIKCKSCIFSSWLRDRTPRGGISIPSPTQKSKNWVWARYCSKSSPYKYRGSKWSLRETIVFDRRQRIKWSPQKLWCSDQWSMNLDSSPFQGWDTLLS